MSLFAGYKSVPTTDTVFTPLSDKAASTVSNWGATTTSSTLSTHTATTWTNFVAAANAKLMIAAAVVVGTSVGLGVGLGIKENESTTKSLYCSWTDYRLPYIAEPLSYDIHWAPTFTAPFTFTGQTTIFINILSDTDCLYIHSGNDLSVTSIQYSTLSSTLSPLSPFTTLSNYDYDSINERYRLHFPTRLTSGTKISLTLSTTSFLSDNNQGLYLSTYKDDGGKTVYMAATQFEATFARRAFPCFDEPSYKATYNITAENIPLTYTALSNMPAQSTVINNTANTQTVQFQTLPKVSTYLVAFVAGPLISVNGTTSNNLPVFIYGVDRTSTRNNLDYALSVALFIIPLYESLYGIPFPLPEMKCAAIPDFAAGAMENMGLITYRETALLANVVTSSASELQRVAVVVSHELAHQWFGDIVTMDWWSALWLNEGFATKMEYVGVSNCCSNFQIDLQFQYSDVFVAMRADSYADVQQLTQYVDSSASIEGMFSSISYSKGGSLLRMTEAYLNSIPDKIGNIYYDAIHNYLVAHAFGNAAPSDLWSAFASTAGIPQVTNWLSQYELTPGYALVSVEWAPGSTGSLIVKQSRHFLSPYSSNIAPTNVANTIWWIPLTIAGEHADPLGPIPNVINIATQAITDPSLAFTTSTWSTTIGDNTNPYNIARDGYIKLNLNMSGYYRVNYPPELWLQFSNSIQYQLANNISSAANTLTSYVLTPADRAELLDNLFTFAEGTGLRNQGINTTLALSYLSKVLPNETSYEVWMPAISHMSTLYSLLVPDIPLANAGNPYITPFDNQPNIYTCSQQFASFSLSYLDSLAMSLGFDNGNNEPLTVLLRVAVLNAAAAFNSSYVRAQAQQYYDNNWQSAPANVQSVILRTLARWSTSNPGDNLYSDLIDAYVTASASGDSTVMSRIAGALTVPRDRILLQKTLNFTLSDSVRVGDRVALITGVASNPFGRDLAWTFMKQNWNLLYDSYGPGGFDLSNLVYSGGSTFTSMEYLTDIQTFFTNNPVPGAIHDFNQALEAIGSRSLWGTIERAEVCGWL